MSSDIEYLAHSVTNTGFILFHNKSNDKLFPVGNAIAGYLLIEQLDSKNSNIYYFQLFVTSLSVMLYLKLKDTDEVPSHILNFYLLGIMLSAYFTITKIKKNQD